MNMYASQRHECRYQTQPECDYYVIRNNFIKYHHGRNETDVHNTIIVILSKLLLGNCLHYVTYNKTKDIEVPHYIN